MTIRGTSNELKIMTIVHVWLRSNFIDLLRPEVYYEAVRSRGPGGQNVNKVSSAAVLFWSVDHSPLFNWDQIHKLKSKLANWQNAEGLIMLRSDQHRDLPQNKEACLEKLVKLIREALHTPKKRIPTKPTRSSKIKKLESKKIRSAIKDSRKKVKH